MVKDKAKDKVRQKRYNYCFQVLSSFTCKIPQAEKYLLTGGYGRWENWCQGCLE